MKGLENSDGRVIVRNSSSNRFSPLFVSSKCFQMRKEFCSFFATLIDVRWLKEQKATQKYLGDRTKVSKGPLY